MAKFTAKGGLKLLSNGDRVSFAFESKDPFQCKVGGLRFLEKHPVQTHKDKNRVRFSGFNRVCSLGTKSSSFSALDCLNDDDDEDDEGDELSCFRGLVLDISYRPVHVVCWKRAICLEFMEKADVLEYYDQTVSSPRGPFYIPAVLRVPRLLQVIKRRRIIKHLSRKNILSRDAFTCQYCSSRDNLTIDHVLPISLGGEWKWENLPPMDMLTRMPNTWTLVLDHIGSTSVERNEKEARVLQLQGRKGDKSRHQMTDIRGLKVTACSKCNSRKGQKTLEEANMKLIKVPKVPKEFDMLAIPLTAGAIKMLKMRKGLPDEWRQYLPKPSTEQ